MPRNEQQIERLIEQLLAAETGSLYGAAASAPRNAAGNRVFDAISGEIAIDVRAAGEEGQDGDGSAG